MWAAFVLNTLMSYTVVLNLATVFGGVTTIRYRMEPLEYPLGSAFAAGLVGLAAQWGCWLVLLVLHPNVRPILSCLLVAGSIRHLWNIASTRDQFAYRIVDQCPDCTTQNVRCERHTGRDAFTRVADIKIAIQTARTRAQEEQKTN